MNLSLMAGTTVTVGNHSAFAYPLRAHSIAGYNLMIFATNWGWQGSWDDFCSKIKKLGYDGAEFWYPQNQEEQKQILSTFEKHNLKFGLLVGSGEREADVHLESFTKQLKGALRLKPVYINCHSGRDYFDMDHNLQFFELSSRLSKETGIPIYHETHRSRILYSAPVSRVYFEKHPDLKITLDISHWCNVHESLLQDQEKTVSLALARTGHIHARIGHPEGPQVNDPRAPEWKDTVDAHFAWWDTVVKAKKSAGLPITFLTEFGPQDYMPALPFTRQPVADQWEINIHMLETLRQRYS